MLPMNAFPIDNDLSTGFVISIKPKSLNSLISLFVNCYISFDQTNDDSRWWGARLYRKVGNGNWTHVTGKTAVIEQVMMQTIFHQLLELLFGLAITIYQVII